VSKGGCYGGEQRVCFLWVSLLRQFGAILLLLVSCVAPAMACMAPEAAMTVEERACCRMMKSTCGQMEMPAPHDCCKKTAGMLHDGALNREADMQQAQAELLRTSITEQVKLLYLRLAYLEATLTILGQNDAVLKPMIDTGLSQYSLGHGTQADVLKAQIEHTKILREVTMHHQEMGQLQAGLKELLHRPQSSPDIIPEPLSMTPLQHTADGLQTLVLAHNPAVSVDTAGVHKQDAQLKSAQREGKPDFNVGYMFQQTGGGYRDYYMLT